MPKLKITGGGYSFNSETIGLEDVKIIFKPLSISEKTEVQTILLESVSENNKFLYSDVEKKIAKKVNEYITIENLEVENEKSELINITSYLQLIGLPLSADETAALLKQLSIEIINAIQYYILNVDELAKKKQSPV